MTSKKHDPRDDIQAMKLLIQMYTSQDLKNLGQIYGLTLAKFEELRQDLAKGGILSDRESKCIHFGRMMRTLDVLTAIFDMSKGREDPKQYIT